jgi:ABC-type Na+ efflux pump permease subunit
VKAVDIALKDLLSALRSAMVLAFMFGLPLMVTGMFYLMFGNLAAEGDFNLPRTRVVIANLDRNAPTLPAGSRNVPGGVRAKTLSGLVVEVLQSEDLHELLDVRLVGDAQTARRMVDERQAQVALIIPEDFSRRFNDPDSRTAILFYQDPTLTIGPGVVESITNQFMDGLAGVKIAVDVALDQPGALTEQQVGALVQGFLDRSASQSKDLAQELLYVHTPGEAERAEKKNPLLQITAPIMAGMMVFYAFYTGASMGQSILLEEEHRTLQRLFTTPTPQSTILSGKLLAVFLTVLVQIGVLTLAARLIFGIDWGGSPATVVALIGTVCLASSFGIFINSLQRDTRKSGLIFGGLLTITGMLGMISVFALNSPSAAQLSGTVALLVPQGWALRGLLQANNGRPLGEALLAGLRQ